MLLTATQMKEVEQVAFARGVKAVDLMETAGQGIAEVVQQFFPQPGIAVLYCGKGNNAGDVLVTGRFLAAAGWKIFIRTAFLEEEMSELARKELQQLKKEPLFFGEEKFSERNHQSFVLLDGLLGIGAQGEPRGEIRNLIEELNKRRSTQGAFVVAADLPSGLDATTGIPSKFCVEADVTAVIAFAKTGLLADTATNYVGRLALVPLTDLTRVFHCSRDKKAAKADGRRQMKDFDQGCMSPCCPDQNSSPTQHLDSLAPTRLAPLGLPLAFDLAPSEVRLSALPALAVERDEILKLRTAAADSASLITTEKLRRLLPSRPFDVHKGIFGHVGIIAGSPGYLGAARLASTAALHAGAGLVTLYTVPEIYDLLAVSVPPEVMVKSVTCYTDVLSERLDAIAIGPGLGLQHQPTILEVIEKATVPSVVDADGLNALAQEIPRLLKIQGPRLLTPHPREMERLFPCKDRIRVQWATDFVTQYPVTLLLKGARTIVAEKEKSIAYNTTGNPGMASGGMGDVLTGVAAALLAAGHQPREAAMLGAWLCGYAAELAIFKEHASQESLGATDVITNLGRAMKDLRAGVF